MLRIMCLLLVSIISIAAAAEDEIDAWYISESGQYLVKESIHGYIYARIEISKGGTASVYFELWDKEDCENADSTVMNHDPVKINGQLVRMSQNCNGNWRNIFPSTDKGRKHLINEFKRKNFVELKGYDNSYRFLFSAKNFTKLYNMKKSLGSAQIQAI